MPAMVLYVMHCICVLFAWGVMALRTALVCSNLCKASAVEFVSVWIFIALAVSGPTLYSV